jgi:hypothetical protein
LWKKAIAVSDAAGHPYVGRDGARVTPKPVVVGKFEATLRNYCKDVLRIPFPE